MKFTTFIKSLLPVLKKDDIVEDIRVTLQELEESTIPAFEGSIKMLGNRAFQSAKVKELDAVFKRNNRGVKNTIEEIYKGLLKCQKNLGIVKEMIYNSYNEEMAAEALDYQRANMLQFVQYSAFVARYSRKLINYIYIMECAEYGISSLLVKESINLAEIRYIEENIVNFSLAFQVVCGDKDKTEKAISNIPDITITPDNEDTLTKIKGAEIDPLNMRLISARFNVIYFIRMAITEFQVTRHKEFKEELKVIQLRKLYLEYLQKGKADPKLEKEIAYLESRIQTLSYKIQKFEEDAQ